MRKHASRVVTRKECLNFKPSRNASESEEDEEEEPSLNQLTTNGSYNLLKDEICSRNRKSMPCGVDYPCI